MVSTYTKIQGPFKTYPSLAQGNFCVYFLGFFLPPVPVAMKRGCGADILINLGLCTLGWLPGVIRKFCR